MLSKTRERNTRSEMFYLSKKGILPYSEHHEIRFISGSEGRKKVFFGVRAYLYCVWNKPGCFFFSHRFNLVTRYDNLK